MVLDASLLNTQHYKVQIKGKVKQSREGVVPSSTPRCSSYRKGSLQVTLDYGCQLELHYFLKKKTKQTLESEWYKNFFSDNSKFNGYLDGIFLMNSKTVTVFFFFFFFFFLKGHSSDNTVQLTPDFPISVRCHENQLDLYCILKTKLKKKYS